MTKFNKEEVEDIMKKLRTRQEQVILREQKQLEREKKWRAEH